MRCRHIGVPRGSYICKQIYGKCHSEFSFTAFNLNFHEKISFKRIYLKIGESNCRFRSLETSIFTGKKEVGIRMTDPSVKLGDYAESLDSKVKERYKEKISSIGIDPFIIPDKNIDSECLPPVESVDLVSYLVLETSHYSQDQFKAYRSLQAYNHMVSGFIQSVQGHIVSGKFVVIGKVRHSQKLNDPCVSLWIITERNGTHCRGCMTGQGECC